MFGRKTLEFMLICIGDEMRDSLVKVNGQTGRRKDKKKAYFFRPGQDARD